MKSVSIVVITYNEEKNISGCLSSLLKVDYPKNKYEILVIDASTDKTFDIASKFKNVKVIKSKEKGFAVQRNLGIKLSKNELVAFTDADCIVPKDWLKVLVSSIESNKVSCVGGNAYPPKDSSHIGLCIACLGFPAGGALGLSDNDPISTCNAIFSKKVIDSIGGFYASLRYGGEDTDITRRLRANGHKVIIEKDSFVYHKTRDFHEFLSWCFRRGKAKFNISKSPLQLLMPLAIFAYPFSSKFRKLLSKRKVINIDLFSIFFVVPVLFFLRQLYMTAGWIYEFIRSFGWKEKHS